MAELVKFLDLLDYNIPMITASEEHRVIRQIMDRYQVGPRFAHEYLCHWYKPEDFASLDLDNLDLSPLHTSWFDFALSTNLRGIEFYDQLAPYLPETSRRYLDVGCGYGGFLVAFAKNGYQVAGLDINPWLVNYSAVNISDFDVDGEVLLADILAGGLNEKLGRFDVISCYDVIEHVDNVPLCLERLVDYLNPGGVLGLKIPNKDSIRFVSSDGHFNLFGITLLEHDLAFQYQQSLFTDEYSVGEYYPLPFYVRSLESLGCTVHVINRDQYLRFRQAPKLISDLLSQYRAFRREMRPKLPAQVTAALNGAFRKYLLELAAAFLIPRNVPAFRERYLVDTWTVLAVKNPQP